MITWIKEWITNVCMTIFFITAAEIILPNNSLKKYSKFVMGLILLVVILNPLIKAIVKDFNASTVISNEESIIQSAYSNNDTKSYKQKDVNNTLTNFQNNLQKVCESKLKSQYKDMTFKAYVKASYDEKKNEYTISQIKIGYSDNSVKKVKTIKVILPDSDSDESDNAPDENIKEKIVQLLNNNLNVPEQKILVYKM